MKTFATLLAVLAFVGCADETPEVEPVIEPAPAVIEPVLPDTSMSMDSTMTGDDMMMDDSTAVTM